MTILIDNGHGSDTPGKRSPDGLFREYSYTREIASRVVSELSDGKWHSASGWSAYTTLGITRSDLLAADLYKAARKHLAGQRIREYNGPKEPDFESNFYVLRRSKCPAVLTENLYQDCRSDVAFLQSSAGKRAIVMLHVEGIIDYLSR